MKKLINRKLYITVFATMIAFALTGCFSPPVLISIEQTGGKTEVATNKPSETISKVDFSEYLYPAFIDETLSHLELPDLLQNSLSKKDKITIVPIDKPTVNSVDAGIFFERALTKKLIDKGYSVYNRNMNVLRQSVLENNSVPALGTEVEKYAELNTKLPSSDMMIGYRLLEIGCQKINTTYRDSIMRVGKVLVELSVINPKTQQIIYDDIVKVDLKNTLSRDLEASTENFHYQFKPYVYTVGNPVLSSITESSIAVKEKEFVQLSRSLSLKSEICFKLSNISSKVEFKIYDSYSSSDVKYFSLDSFNSGAILKYNWNLKNNDGESVKPGDYSLLYKREGPSPDWFKLKDFIVKP